MTQEIVNWLKNETRKLLDDYKGNVEDFLNGLSYGLRLSDIVLINYIDVTMQLKKGLQERKEVKIDSPRIVELGFSVRLINCLKSAGIETLNELLRINAASLLLLPNFGKKTLQELQKYYEENGYTFGNEYLERIHVDNRYVYWLKGKKYKWFL